MWLESVAVIPDPLRGLRVPRQSALRIPYYIIIFSLFSCIIDNGYTFLRVFL